MTRTNRPDEPPRPGPDADRLVRLSKFLSKHLRHEPARIGLTLEPGGWVGVAELLAACGRHGVAIDRPTLDEVVARNAKRRFAFDEAGARIRAQQGHSVPVELGLAPEVPPPVLYHGTPRANAGAIRLDGLRKMGRHHVHLSPDVATARAVGARRGRPVLFEVAAAAMHNAGATFFRSGNDVWLVDHVPPIHLTELAGR